MQWMKKKRAVHVENTDTQVNLETQQDSRALDYKGQRWCQWALDKLILSLWFYIVLDLNK